MTKIFDLPPCRFFIIVTKWRITYQSIVVQHVSVLDAQRIVATNINLYCTSAVIKLQNWHLGRDHLYITFHESPTSRPTWKIKCRRIIPNPVENDTKLTTSNPFKYNVWKADSYLKTFRAWKSISIDLFFPGLFVLKNRQKSRSHLLSPNPLRVEPNANVLQFIVDPKTPSRVRHSSIFWRKFTSDCWRWMKKFLWL